MSTDFERCNCGRGWYDPDEYRTCYECFLERRSEYIECIFCGRWHSPDYGTCYRCRALHPGRDEAGRDLRVDILQRDDYACQYCGNRDGFQQIDHVKPCAEGGTADPWNLQVLCAECNRWKGRTWFLGSRHDKARLKLMHLYFVYGWQYLTDEQRAQLVLDADEYGPEFERHARYKTHQPAAPDEGAA